MRDPSAPVTSRQTDPHPRLIETVRKHAQRPWRRPVSDHARPVFEALARRVESWPGPLVLDTGCGTGQGTSALARRHPTSLVLGVDKSASRLDRAPGQPENALLVRLDLEDFWPLALAAGWKFSLQCFFYPNPWPKPEQRLRRWPFHPVLPLVLACGEVWEVRTNWEVYAREFALAYGELTAREPQVGRWFPDEPDTLFERKYRDSGHALWRWVSGPGPEPSL